MTFTSDVRALVRTADGRLLLLRRQLLTGSPRSDASTSHGHVPTLGRPKLACLRSGVRSALLQSGFSLFLSIDPFIRTGYLPGASATTTAISWSCYGTTGPSTSHSRRRTRGRRPAALPARGDRREVPGRAHYDSCKSCIDFSASRNLPHSYVCL